MTLLTFVQALKGVRLQARPSFAAAPEAEAVLQETVMATSSGSTGKTGVIAGIVVPSLLTLIAVGITALLALRRRYRRAAARAFEEASGWCRPGGAEQGGSDVPAILLNKADSRDLGADLSDTVATILHADSAHTHVQHAQVAQGPSTASVKSVSTPRTGLDEHCACLTVSFEFTHACGLSVWDLDRLQSWAAAGVHHIDQQWSTAALMHAHVCRRPASPRWRPMSSGWTRLHLQRLPGLKRPAAPWSG